MVSCKSGGATLRANICAVSWLIVTDAFNHSIFERKGTYMEWTQS
jgi:hypothetical protein